MRLSAIIPVIMLAAVMSLATSGCMDMGGTGQLIEGEEIEEATPVVNEDIDGDGIPNNKDNCPEDPNPDQADNERDGIGDVCDLDDDNDTVMDESDCCPMIANRDQKDTDSDGYGDMCDNCKTVANPTQSNADEDSAGDACDECIDDPQKIEEGQCGCGEPDTDGDDDGTADCNDNCPSDPDKTAPGDCGCGTPDTDSDTDGTPDCNDECPDDAGKTEPGICGCGVADTDSDTDGTPDCNDACPGDPAKIIPGDCGCGTPDTDSDGDGVADCIDNCPDDPNPGQEDADGDGTGDACEGGALLEICDNFDVDGVPIDDDGDGKANCADAKCLGTGTSPCEPYSETTCSDTIDNDGDADDIFGEASAGADYVDCGDNDCDGQDGGGGTCEYWTESNCTDGFDNDGNDDQGYGTVDCGDLDCYEFYWECYDEYRSSYCPEAEPDCDFCAPGYWCDISGVCTCGSWDCQICDIGDGICDSECYNEDCNFDGGDCLTPPVETGCSDWGDNDHDGAYDCYDTDCVGDPACCELNCWNAYIGDGYCDGGCEDVLTCTDGSNPNLPTIEGGDCAPSEVGLCDDWEDNDGDWLTDCEDPDCVDSVNCCAQNCSINGNYYWDEPASGWCYYKCYNVACNWDKGDCDDTLEGTCAENCKVNQLDDGSCDAACNVANCNYDGGDCCTAPMIGDGNCDAQCNFVAHSFDGGDCCDLADVGNGTCDSECNSAAFTYDGRDCCHDDMIGDGTCDLVCYNRWKLYDNGDCP